MKRPDPGYRSRPDLREWVRGVLETEGRGHEQAIMLRVLCDRDDCPRVAHPRGYHEETDPRQVRLAIADLATIDGVPIVGDSRCGYYLVDSAEDLKRASRELHRRAMRMLRREKRVLDNGRHLLGGQMRLHLRMVTAQIGLGDDGLGETDDYDD